MNGARYVVLGLASVRALGPAPAPLSKLRGRFRHHLLVKSKERAPLHRAARAIAWEKPRWSTTRVVVDIDPVSLM